VARAELQSTVEQRMTDGIRARLKEVEQLGEDERLKAGVQAAAPIYSYEPTISPHDDDEVDARAHQQTWDDVLRQQTEGIYPPAFAAIKVTVLMMHGTFDPLPGRLIFKGLQSYLPQLEYRELDRCGHYPWLEPAAAPAFFRGPRVVKPSAESLKKPDARTHDASGALSNRGPMVCFGSGGAAVSATSTDRPVFHRRRRCQVLGACG
jgi:hypothetical protein